MAIQIRRDTAAHWASQAPTLRNGELGLVTDTGGLYLGDGATAFALLPPVGGWDVNLISTDNETADNAQNQDHTELQFAVTSGDIYYFELMAGISGNNTTGDCAINVVTTGTWGTAQSNSNGVDYSETAVLRRFADTAFASTTNMAAAPGRTCNNGDGTIRPVRYFGTFTATGDGTVKVQFGLVSAAAGRTCTLHKGARLLARRIRQA